MNKKNIKWFLSKISGQDEDCFNWGDFFSNILMYGCMAFLFLIFPVLCFKHYNIVVAGVVAGVQWISIGIALTLFIRWQNRNTQKLKTPSSKPKDKTNSVKDRIKKIDKEKDSDIYASIVRTLYTGDVIKESECIDYLVVDSIYDNIINAIGLDMAREIFVNNHKTDTETTDDNTDTDIDTKTDTDSDIDTDTKTDTKTDTDIDIQLRGLSFINKQFVTECLNNKRPNSFQHAVSADGTNGFWFPTECKYIDYSNVYTTGNHKLCTRDGVLLMTIKLISNGYYKKGERIFNHKFLRSEIGIRSDVAKEVFEALLDADIISHHCKDYYVLSNYVDEWYCSYKLRNLYKLGYLYHKDYKGKDTKWRSNYMFK